jgi:hypothetical protein
VAVAVAVAVAVLDGEAETPPSTARTHTLMRVSHV